MKKILLIFIITPCLSFSQLNLDFSQPNFAVKAGGGVGYNLSVFEIGTTTFLNIEPKVNLALDLSFYNYKSSSMNQLSINPNSAQFSTWEGEDCYSKKKLTLALNYNFYPYDWINSEKEKGFFWSINIGPYIQYDRIIKQEEFVDSVMTFNDQLGFLEVETIIRSTMQTKALDIGLNFGVSGEYWFTGKWGLIGDIRLPIGINFIVNGTHSSEMPLIDHYSNNETTDLSGSEIGVQDLRITVGLLFRIFND